MSHKVDIDVDPPEGDATMEAQRRLNERRPTGPAEALALKELRTLARADSDSIITSDRLPEFGSSVADFDKALEDHVVKRGWFGERPSKVVSRWAGRGVLAMFAGIGLLFAGFFITASGLVLIGAAAIAGSIVMLVLAQSMPAVTMPGAMIRAMLAAYRRTLEKTMAQARSMQEVVDGAGLTWLETPDQAVVWGTALGLQHEIEQVLERSLADLEEGTAAASSLYFPGWYQTSSGSSFAGGAALGSGASVFSDSRDPGPWRDDVGAGHHRQRAVLVRGWRRGRFGGGSSGGGGGGAGGGF